MTDWARIKTAICEGREFALTDAGCRVLADTMMPSGALIYVHMQLRGDRIFAHDGGAAFDELARHAAEITSLRGVRQHLKETGFRLTDEGFVWRDGVEVADAAVGISLVADASFRAAQYMLAHAKLPSVPPLDRRLIEGARARYPSGHANYAVQGKNRQHTFDFGVPLGDRLILLQAVTPDSSSIASAIMKGLDAKEAPGSNVVPLFVFDPADRWQSGSLSMLDFGGTALELDAVVEGHLPLAA
ncbi:hypothetical protein [uncultured Sphingomonas sp.]|uniref:hypothetical protein n=1 Tax=uncultured Sphingomonas sp. TaxID=158754 RepID=UPI0025F186A3|nr:hypothetical protein [uncultured Sphingomonas sp.]